MLLLPKPRNAWSLRCSFRCKLDTTDAKKLGVSSAKARKEQNSPAMHVGARHRSCLFHCLRLEDRTLLAVERCTFNWHGFVAFVWS